MSATDDLHLASHHSGAALPPTPAADIASASARVGAYTWLASRLFEVVGGWVASTPDPATKVYFAGAARRFADHAAAWHERLPRLREAARGDLVRAPGPTATALVESLERVSAPHARVAALRAVMGRLDEVLADHGATISLVREASTASTLRWVRSDLADLLAESASLAPRVTVDTSAAGSERVDGDADAFAVTGLALFT